MSYRILRITNIYSECLTNYYLRFPEIHNSSYIEQYEHLTADSVEIAYSYSKNLRKLGVDAIDIISNADILQSRWAIEHLLTQNISLKDLVFEQIKSYQPDIVWIDDSKLMDKSWASIVKKEVGSIKLIVSHICAPYNSKLAEFFSSVDMMFTCTPCFKKDLMKLGVETHLLYHGFDDSVLKMLGDDNSAPKYDLIFTGSLYTGYGFHKSRIEFIQKFIESNINIQIFGNLESNSKIFFKKSMQLTINLLLKFRLNFIINNISLLKKNENYGKTKISNYSKKLRQSVNPPIFGIEMFTALRNSNICFNIHGEIARKCAGNIRLFEATGVGICLLTDWKDNLNELFEPEKEVVTYKTIDECIEKVNWLLKNPEEARKIAKAGQERTLKDHTIENRAKYINQLFIKKLNENN
ncbi:MAG: glycosyltransferase [Bacteroidota bacterium]